LHTNKSFLKCDGFVSSGLCLSGHYTLFPLMRGIAYNYVMKYYRYFNTRRINQIIVTLWGYHGCYCFLFVERTERQRTEDQNDASIL